MRYNHGWLAAIGLGAAAGCHAAERPGPDRAAPVPIAVHQLWQHAFEIGPAARRSLVIVPPCTIWIVAGGASAWSCEGDSLTALPEGDGPGEFRYTWLASSWDDDSLAIWDAALARLSILDSTGHFVRSVQLPILMNQGARVAGIFRHAGALHVWADPYPIAFGAADSAPRGHVWAVADGATSLTNSLLSFEGPLSTVIRDATTFSRVDAPVRRRPLVAVLGDGTTVVASSGSDSVQVYSWAGAPAMTIALDLTADPVTSDDRAKYADSIRESIRGELAAQRLGPKLDSFFLRRAEALVKAANWPATRQRMDLLVAGTGSRFWILRPAFGADRGREWREYDTSGTLHRVLHVPHWGSVGAAAVTGDTLTTLEFRFGADSTVLARYAP